MICEKPRLSYNQIEQLWLCSVGQFRTFNIVQKIKLFLTYELFQYMLFLPFHQYQSNTNAYLKILTDTKTGVLGVYTPLHSSTESQVFSSISYSTIGYYGKELSSNFYCPSDQILSTQKAQTGVYVFHPGLVTYTL